MNDCLKAAMQLQCHSMYLFFTGNVLLVTNVETSPLPLLLRDVLKKQSDSIAGHTVSFHKDFRLLLRSSVPLYVRGTVFILNYYYYYHYYYYYYYYYYVVFDAPYVGQLNDEIADVEVT